MTNAEMLWIDYMDDICDDIAHILQELFPNDQTYTVQNHSLFYYGSAILDYGLYLINMELNDQGKTLEDYQMPRYEYN